MRDSVYHPEVDEIINALRPLASKATVKSAHWISTPDGTYETDNGSEWCSDCGMAMLKHLRKHDRKRADQYILDGGWVSEHDTPPMCAHCCVKLEATLLFYGGTYELDHFRENPPAPGNVDHAHEVSEMLSAFQYTKQEDGYLAKEAIEIGRTLVTANAAALTRDRVNYWTEAEKAIAIAGLEGGKPYREILQDLRDAGYERGHTSIFKFASKHNFNRAPDPWTHEQIERLRVLYEAKTPVKEIAAELGRPIASVRTRASNLGFKQRIAWTEREYEILREASEKGERLTDTAQMIGRPYPNVAAVASRLGLSFKKVAKGG